MKIHSSSSLFPSFSIAALIPWPTRPDPPVTKITFFSLIVLSQSEPVTKKNHNMWGITNWTLLNSDYWAVHSFEYRIDSSTWKPWKELNKQMQCSSNGNNNSLYKYLFDITDTWAILITFQINFFYITANNCQYLYSHSLRVQSRACQVNFHVINWLLSNWNYIHKQTMQPFCQAVLNSLQYT